ncbi:natural resistance-associated macrophage protein-domain-containing protein [Boeremia exigua]|uniref:natural resistance-associated macrophage protein-domain-containing protein n=1 Tax=Boeremia exigua TaxID=749465 RepID=UPI001E8CA11C|nr:natural resistance-associated macrophage protein-domain-containing protein [Boeremia exigua]KAH6633455.1 natural resistance-associated macrophage protein-domain-containing protein [Boeremia exigua]
MNCPSRTEPEFPEGYNQNPNALNADATTRADLGYMANTRARDDHRIDFSSADNGLAIGHRQVDEDDGTLQAKAFDGLRRRSDVAGKAGPGAAEAAIRPSAIFGVDQEIVHSGRRGGILSRAIEVVRKYLKFIGPGFMVAVAYIDPGNYATDVAAGASFEFKLLFIVLMSNMFAIFLQALCIKLGSVTGMNLAQNCKAHLPPWLNYVLYFFAESAIIATDIAEVIGTAIALNILIKVPLVAGCAISIVDVLIILIFYSPSGTMRAVRGFECFVALLVLGVVICFCFELSKIHASVGEVFHGYVPSSTLVKSQALYQACGILGATVMPHSLYLGSGIVQPRLREYDDQHNSTSFRDADTDSLTDELKYRPSLAAIKHCMSYSIAELAISLFTFALFVNSAILIVSGASLYGQSEATDADLFSIHSLLSRSIAPIAGTLFALALLLSGTSAGIVCTIAGQMVSEGQLNWTMRPWMRRLLTRTISITPSIVIAGSVGQEGLSKALNGSQFALSVILPFVSAPLIWFTCRAQYMKVLVRPGSSAAPSERESAGASDSYVQMRNHWITTAFAVIIWGVIVVMNVAALVFAGMGVS